MKSSGFVEIDFQSTINLREDFRRMFLDEIVVTNEIKEVPTFRLIVGFHSVDDNLFDRAFQGFVVSYRITRL